ncbi:hypothetical protein [Aurantimonas endophytica]|uniref:Uncharacterized protein n=1 Tax=Aurantimonas endophytica TaxID=1522175 RepID=A0A7W6MS43_9HYPH|nr:hypothetical protein [Aurantimonas endophytica]MBB4005644.1 hypothetical protein [Aurantimonas endophytica]
MVTTITAAAIITLKTADFTFKCSLIGLGGKRNPNSGNDLHSLSPHEPTALLLELLRQLIKEGYSGQITLSQFQRFQDVRDQLEKDGFKFGLPSGN